MHKYHKSFYQLIWPFYGLLQLYELKIQKTRIFAIQCKSIINRVFTLFYRFMVYYNRLSWDLRKLITPQVQYTGIPNRVLSIFDFFTPSYNCMSLSIKKTLNSASLVDKYHKSCS